MQRMRAVRNGTAACLSMWMMSMFVFAAPLTAEDTMKETVTIRPAEYPHALKNPLMGFRSDYPHPFGTLQKFYIPWDELENKESDGPEKIRAYCDQLWKDLPQHNVKAMPRVWLYMPPEHAKVTHRWPSDMQKDDYSSPQFKTRVVNLINKLGQCWDTDPRVAYVEMGIIGKWGEQHSPNIPADMQDILGKAYTTAFTNKLVMVRHARDFRDYRFGIYWDSWAHQDQVHWKEGGGLGIAALGDRWKTAVMGGETAYDWGNYKIQPGDNPTDTVTDPTHRKFLIDTIRKLHCNHLGWVSDYDTNSPPANLGAAEVQKALGYRFVIEEVSYPAMVSSKTPFIVRFAVRNTGSSPIYCNWPVEVSFLHPKTRDVVWHDTFEALDIRRWLPGDKWNTGRQAYDVEPQLCKVEGTFALPESVKTGEYILALAILDPAGMRPSARFAIRSYFKGGRHPIGMIGVGSMATSTTVDPATFDDPSNDMTIHYTYTPDSRSKP